MNVEPARGKPVTQTRRGEAAFKPALCRYATDYPHSFVSLDSVRACSAYSAPLRVKLAPSEPAYDYSSPILLRQFFMTNSPVSSTELLQPRVERVLGRASKRLAHEIAGFWVLHA